MDEQLAAIYGTNQVAEETDLEKVAAAELLVKLAAEEGLDLDQFSDQEIAEMVTELQGGIEHTAQAEPEIDQEAQEKFAEADFLGRVMAHSMVQELNNIEKEAGRVGEGVKKVVEKVKSEATKPTWAGRQLRKMTEAKRQAKEAVTGWSTPGRSGGQTALTKAERVGRALGAAGSVPGAKGTALVGGGILAGKAMGKKKEGSADGAIAKLAEQRAYEMLAEAGYVDEEGNVTVPQEKQASALEQVVEQQALQMLEAAGYPVEWDQ